MILVIPILLCLLFRNASANPKSTGVFESLHAVRRLEAHPQVFATIACHDNFEPGITVLHEGLLRAGHRQPLVVLATHRLSDSVRARLASLAGVVVFRADHDPPSFCGVSDATFPALGDCAHLKLLLFALAAVKKVIFLEYDLAVLRSLNDLVHSPPFTAIREPHVGLFDTGVMVLVPDVSVYGVLKDEFCARASKGELISDADVIREVVPEDAWTEASDTFNVPQEHMDTLWYRRVDKKPAVIHFKGETKPWNFWKLGTGGAMSLRAFNRWCDVAEGTRYECGRPKGYEMEPPLQPSGWSEKNKLTVILSTYHRPTWRTMARYYAGFKCVHEVVLVWHDPDGDPPLPSQLGLKVSVWQPKTDSLNNRFFGGGNLTEGVYICDDDMKVSEEQLLHGFHIWRGHSRRLIGFFPRKWMMEEPHYSARIHDGYNIVLTKGLYTHRYFLYMYVHLLPKRVKDVVDRYNDCEDIAFNMMVSGYNGVAPLHAVVDGDIIDMGHGGGISKRGAHYLTRFQCVKELIKEMELSSTPMSVGSLSEKALKNKEREWQRMR